MKKILLSLLLLLFPAACLAFSILPSKFVLTIDPGNSQSLNIEIKNDGDTEKKYSLKVTGLSQDIDGKLVSKEKSDIAEYWVSYEDKNFSIAAKGSQKIPITIAVPKGTAPGSHLIGIGINEKNGESISAELVAVVKIAVAGKAIEALEMKDLSPLRKIFLSDSWKFSTIFKNAGNVDVDMRGAMEVSDFFDRQVYQSEIKIGGTVLSQSERQVSLSAKSDRKFLLPGVYHAYVKIDYGLTNQSLVRETDFWYFPGWFFGVFTIGVLLFIFFKFFYKKKHFFKNE